MVFTPFQLAIGGKGPYFLLITNILLAGKNMLLESTGSLLKSIQTVLAKSEVIVVLP